MALYKSEIDYHKSIRKAARLKNNDRIDNIVKNSISDIECDCGMINSMRQVKRGSYIIECTSCGDKYRLEE